LEAGGVADWKWYAGLVLFVLLLVSAYGTMIWIAVSSP
jgi:hypothetical protein